ncbi:hypothetical protein [Mechercharimyces sp. CAU 1602]|uniref:hypothetical protein n=1 Tax=Mechercharimyces sp. CAU 1602 TaxID=2973933 RepID=UPI0021631500|nr:hypothetical protein [Mechercharimyces sp. CAU 1602]MCS1351290.1 hypothetical protein [Mechercharimyces sp. CAU 1602]
MSSQLTQTLIVVVNRNAFLVLDDPRGRRSIIGISLAYAAILNRRFGIPVRRVSLPSTSADVFADFELGAGAAPVEAAPAVPATPADLEGRGGEVFLP